MNTFDLMLALLGAFGAGFGTCFVLFCWLGARAAREEIEAKTSPRVRSEVIMHVRHDVHHHGLGSDDGEAWKRARDE